MSCTNPPPIVAEPVPGRHEHADVGPTEPVDRLLRVADHEEVAGREVDLVPLARARLGRTRVGGRDAGGQLDLDRVGVLELVEEQPLVPLVEAGADGRAVLGSRSSERASTSRSWKASSPDTRRSSAARSVKARIAVAMRRTAAWTHRVDGVVEPPRPPRGCRSTTDLLVLPVGALPQPPALKLGLFPADLLDEVDLVGARRGRRSTYAASCSSRSHERRRTPCSRTSARTRPR